MTQMPAHSKVGFSKRKQWSTCPGSVKLSENMPSKQSAYAGEGTAAHALQEWCLRALLNAGEVVVPVEPINFVGEEFLYDDHGEDKAIVVSQEMGEALQHVYEDIEAALLANEGSVLLVEERFHLKELHSDLFGTGDVCIWFPESRRLQVRDLKYGAGVAVDIEDEDGQANLQLEGYALGALLKYPQWKAVDVEMVIDQPRAPHVDGRTRSTIRPVSYFVDMAADLVDEVKRTERAAEAFGKMAAVLWQREHLKAGDHCRWCAAAPVCPLLKDKAQELAKQVFAPAQQYNAGHLAETLDWLPILEAWIKNVREFAYSEAEKGHAIPHWKIVEKRATRKWKSEESAVLWLKQMGVQPYGEAPVISPAAAEKTLNKEQKTFMAALVVAESSGHTLVHESDKREAVKLDAASAFANR